MSWRKPVNSSYVELARSCPFICFVAFASPDGSGMKEAVKGKLEAFWEPTGVTFVHPAFGPEGLFVRIRDLGKLPDPEFLQITLPGPDE